MSGPEPGRRPRLRFGGNLTPQFEDAASAQVGAVFTGGGGWYPADTDFRSWRGDEFADPIDKCEEATDIRDVVCAYPAA